MTVKGVGAATITITATSPNYDNATAKVTVNVKPAASTISSLAAYNGSQIVVKYTKAEEITLNLVCKGDFLVTMFGHYTDGSDISKEFYDTNEYHLKEKSEISITVPKNIRSSVVGFQIAALSSGSKKKSSNETAFYLYEGNWSALIDKSSINDIRIALTTVTFKKEEYIICNMELLERELFYTDEPAKDHIKVRIIDNGRTLDPEDFKSEYMELIHNENTGGSGGYTRGMILSYSCFADG